MNNWKLRLLFSSIFGVGALILNWLILGETSPFNNYFLWHVGVPNIWAGLNIIPALISALIAGNPHSGTDLRFKCGVKGFSRLCKSNGVPLAAKGLSYFFSGIQWRAGRGWPIYATRCPIEQVNRNDPFPGALHHSLVVYFGGGYWPECGNSNVARTGTITDIFVGPNDDQYDDNTGEFTFVIAGLEGP